MTNLFVHRGRKSAKRGFTLIELLVVIAIIAILASILFPVFARARQNARKAADQSNLKQIGLAIMQYAQDYDERLPMANFQNGLSKGYWFNLVQPYIKSTQIFVCPDAPANTANGFFSYGWNVSGTLKYGTYSTAGGNGFGYEPQSGFYGTPGNVIGLSLAAVTDPSTTIQVADPSSNGYSGNGIYAPGYVAGAAGESYIPVLYGGQPYLTPQATAITLTDFSGGGNYLFADGHVKWLSASQSYCSSMWDVDKNLHLTPATAPTCTGYH